MLSNTKLAQFMENMSTQGLIALFAGILLVRWVLRGIYRVYFHPLSKFPGPKLNAFTRIPYLRCIARGTQLKEVSKLHDQYGEVVRISPDELSFLHPHAWRDIYGHGSKEGRGSAPPKDWTRYGTLPNGTPSIVVIPDAVEHARARKMFTPAFSDRALIEQSQLFTKYADQLVSVLKGGNANGGVFDMVRMYNFTTFDVMGDLTFGEPLHMLDNAEYDPWVTAIFQNVKRGVKLGTIYRWYPLATAIIQTLLGKTLEKKKLEHFNHSTTRVTKRLEKGRESEGVDLWSLVLSQEEKGKAGLTRAQMDSNAGLFMIAGTETTATLLDGLTYLLLTNPESMKKLVSEIRGSFASSDEISIDAIAGLPYLNACIKEALRRYPPVPIGLPHLTAREGSTICGHFVPPNTNVAASHLIMYSSPKFFKDPESFIPERWTGDERFADDDRSVLQPFSVGSRDCLGKNMAYHEMRLLATKVLFNFDLELMPESREWSDQKIWLLWEKKPLICRVTPVSA